MNHFRSSCCIHSFEKFRKNCSTGNSMHLSRSATSPHAPFSVSYASARTGPVSLHDSCRQVTIRDGNKLISNKLIHIRHIRRQTVCLICFSSRLPPVLLHDLYGTTCQQVVQIIPDLFHSLSHSLQVANFSTGIAVILRSLSFENDLQIAIQSHVLGHVNSPRIEYNVFVPYCRFREAHCSKPF